VSTAQAVQAAGSKVADSKPMGWLARTGLTARAIVYLLMGWLALLVASGGHAHVDQRGALSEVLAQPMGTVLVWGMALGFIAYAVWRLSEAAFGVEGDGRRAGPRIKSLVRGLAYAVLAFGAISLLNGVRSTQAGQQAHLASTVMQHSGGRWLVGIIGVIVVGVAVMMILEGWSSAFMRYFGYLPQPRRSIIVWLGRIGSVARGIVFLVTGILIAAAAWTAQPKKAGGIDETFRTILDQPYGAQLVAALGLGLMVFGVYGLAEAIWRHVPDSRPS